MNELPPSVKIELIHRSRRCFWLGVFSLVPVLGLPLVLMALMQNRRIKALALRDWHAGQRAQYWGVVWARTALALFLIELTVVVALNTLMHNFGGTSNLVE